MHTEIEIDEAALAVISRQQEKLEEFWAGVHARDAAWTERWAPSLTPETVIEIERKMDSGEPLTQEDIERYVAARELSQPESRGHVDEDGLWQMDDDCIEEWDAWYKQPLAEALRDRLPKQTPPKPPSRRPLQPAPAQRRGTSRATKRRRRHSAGSKGSSRGDPDSEPPLTRLQRARLAISDARRAALEQRLLAGIRECVGCRLDHPADEFRSGRRVCRRCETMARLERRAREVAA